MDANASSLSDHKRFEAMYRAEAGTVLMFASHRVGRLAADDIVADTFAIAWRKLEEVPTPPTAWLLGVARKVIGNYLRSQRRRPAEQLGDNDLAVVDDLAEAVALRHGFATAIAQLDPKSREVVILAAWYDLTQKEMAQVMGCSAVAVGVRLHRARKALRRLLSVSDRPASPTITEVRS